MNQSSAVALVTGASSGIGAATASALATAGYRVYGLSRRGHSPTDTQGLVADITDAATVQQAVTHIIDEAGQLDLLVHAAGIGGGAPVEQMPIAEYRRIMDTNFYGALQVLQATLPHLRARPRATAIVVSSIAGLTGVPFHSAYSASKFALEGLVESLRLELRSTSVRLVSVCPGDTNTPILQGQYRLPPAEALSVYRPAYTRFTEVLHNHMGHGMEPEYVASEIVKIIGTEQPAPRYPIGNFTQKVSTTVRHLLPAHWYEKMVANYWKL